MAFSAKDVQALREMTGVGMMDCKKLTARMDIGHVHALAIADKATDLDVLTTRAMNMVEADIRLTQGNGNFRLDAWQPL